MVIGRPFMGSLSQSSLLPNFDENPRFFLIFSDDRLHIAEGRHLGVDLDLGHDLEPVVDPPHLVRGARRQRQVLVSAVQRRARVRLGPHLGW